MFYNKTLIFILKIICAKRKHLALFYLLQKTAHVIDIWLAEMGDYLAFHPG